MNRLYAPLLSLFLGAVVAPTCAQTHAGFIVRSQSQAFEHGSCEEFDCSPREGTFASPDTIFFRIYGEQGGAWVIAMSAGTWACTPIPGFDDSLVIDPTLAVGIAAGTLRMNGFNLCRRARGLVSLPVPGGIPSGVSVVFQGFAVTTNGGLPTFTRPVRMTRPTLPTS